MGWKSSKLTHDTLVFPLVWYNVDSFGTHKEGAYMYFNLKDFRGRGGRIKEAYYLGQCEHGVWQKSLTFAEPGCPIAGGLVSW